MSRRSSDQAQQLALPLPAAALHTAMLCCNGGLDVRSQWSNDINIWWDKCRKPCIYNLALLHQPVFDVASSKSKLIRAVFAGPERLKQAITAAMRRHNSNAAVQEAGLTPKILSLGGTWNGGGWHRLNGIGKKINEALNHIEPYWPIIQQFLTSHWPHRAVGRSCGDEWNSWLGGAASSLCSKWSEPLWTWAWLGNA